MKYENVKVICHVRSAIYRKSKSEIKYAKNHELDFDERVPREDQMADDWEEYDPNDEYEISLGADSY